MIIFMFDIDETILTTEKRLKTIHADIPRQISIFSPYEPLGLHESCYTLNKEKMTSIFAKILQNGHKIGFITAGKIEKEGIRKFIKIEYGIDLGEFIHSYEANDKVVILKAIAKDNRCLDKDIYLIDDNLDHISRASIQGFSTMHVDTHPNCGTHGTYITELEKTLEKLQMDEKSEESNDEKAPFIPKKPLKFPRIILQSEGKGEAEIKLGDEVNPGELRAKLTELMNKQAKAPYKKRRFFETNPEKIIKSINLTKYFTACFKRSH